MSSSGSGTVINYGSGSGSDFLTSYGSGSTSQKVTVPTAPVPVPQHCLYENPQRGADDKPKTAGEMGHFIKEDMNTFNCALL
jgi:hypothetical protein